MRVPIHLNFIPLDDVTPHRRQCFPYKKKFFFTTLNLKRKKNRVYTYVHPGVVIAPAVGHKSI